MRPLRPWLAHRSCISYAPIYAFQIPVNRLPKHPADRSIILIGDVSDALKLRFGQDDRCTNSRNRAAGGAGSTMIQGSGRRPVAVACRKVSLDA